MQTRLVALKCHQSNQIKCSREDKYSRVRRSKGEITHYTTSRLLHMRVLRLLKTRTPRTPFSPERSPPDRCAHKTWKQQPFSLELLCWVKPAFEDSGWAAVFEGEGRERERQRGTERGRVSGGWEWGCAGGGGGGVSMRAGWQIMISSQVITTTI